MKTLFIILCILTVICLIGLYYTIKSVITNYKELARLIKEENKIK